jgi:hypothetical protein
MLCVALWSTLCLRVLVCELQAVKCLGVVAVAELMQLARSRVALTPFAS